LFGKFVFWELPQCDCNLYRYDLLKLKLSELSRIISKNVIKIGSQLQKLTEPDLFHEKVIQQLLLKNLKISENKE